MAAATADSGFPAGMTTKKGKGKGAAATTTTTTATARATADSGFPAGMTTKKSKGKGGQCFGDLGEFEQLVLLAVLRLGDAAYGVSIRAEIELCADRKISAGALYTTLDRLEQKGFVDARSGEPTPERGGRAKRFYKVTREGQSRLTAAQLAFRRMLSGLNLIGENHG